MQIAGIDKAKVSRKNNPTFLLKSDEMLTKMKPGLFDYEFTTSFEEKFNKLHTQQPIGSVRDLAEKLRE